VPQSVAGTRGITKGAIGKPITVLANAALGKGTNVNGRRAIWSPAVHNRANPRPFQMFNPAALPPISHQSGYKWIGSVLCPVFFATDLSLRKVLKIAKERHEPHVPGRHVQILIVQNFVLGGLGNASLTAGSGNFGAVGAP